MSKAKIVYLISPPTKTCRTPEECLGLEYLAVAANNAGFYASYIDPWLQNISTSSLLDQILIQQPEVIGLAPSLDSKQETVDFIFALRARGYVGQIVLGGVYASFEAENLLLEVGHVICGVFIGEADITFVDFLLKGSMERVANTAYLSVNQEVVFNPRDALVANLDELSLPDRQMLPFVRAARAPSHIMGSRGCIGNCSFCSIACYQKFSSTKRWRGRSPQNIAIELEYLASLGESMVKFVDDNFFSDSDNEDRENKLAALMIEKKIAIKFRISLRVDNVKECTIKNLKTAGLFATSLGVESFVQRKLNTYAKGVSVAQNLQALKILTDNKIFIQMGHIMFDPFVVREEIEAELFFLEQNKLAVTKGIWTKLFAATGTRITDYIIEKLGDAGKDALNYHYDIVDKWANNFYQAVRVWEKAVRSLYDKIIDPISAPKNIDFDLYAQFHDLYIDFKDIEFSIVKKLLAINTDDLESFINIINDEIVKAQPALTKIKHKNQELYVKAKLAY